MQDMNELTEDQKREMLFQHILQKAGQREQTADLNREQLQNASFAGAMAKGAAQAGVMGGKMADTSVVDDSYKNLQSSMKDQSQDTYGTDLKRRMYEALYGKLLADSRFDTQEDMQNKIMGERRAEAEAKARRDEADRAAKYGDSAADRAAKEKEANANRDARASEAEADRKARAAEGNANRAVKKEEKKTGKSDPKIPAGVATEIGSFKTAVKALEDLKVSWDAKASQTGSGIGQFIPFTQASQYNDEKNVAAQVIGVIVEGGKTTNEDYSRYKDMMPSASDNKAGADNKVRIMRELIEHKRKEKLRAAQQAGYDVSGFGEDFVQKVGGEVNFKVVKQAGKTYKIYEDGRTEEVK